MNFDTEKIMLLPFLSLFTVAHTLFYSYLREIIPDRIRTIYKFEREKCLSRSCCKIS